MYRTADGYIVVGTTVTDPEVLAGLAAGVGDGETAVFVPADVLAEMADR